MRTGYREFGKMPFFTVARWAAVKKAGFGENLAGFYEIPAPKIVPSPPLACSIINFEKLKTPTVSMPRSINIFYRK